MARQQQLAAQRALQQQPQQLSDIELQQQLSVLVQQQALIQEVLQQEQQTLLVLKQHLRAEKQELQQLQQLHSTGGVHVAADAAATTGCSDACASCCIKLLLLWKPDGCWQCRRQHVGGS